MTAALVWCPFPDADAALAAIDVLLDEGLIACGNVLPGMRSRFIWNGVKDSADEAGAILKTRADLLEHAIARCTQLHPYAAPAIVGWRCEAAAAGTLAWLSALGH